MYSEINPFSQLRAELMGPELWKMFVPGPFARLTAQRPLVLEGGRGSGKTMFFLCNSWRERLSNVKANGGTIKNLLQRQIGRASCRERV